jgi:hypothetical protein
MVVHWGRRERDTRRWQLLSSDYPENEHPKSRVTGVTDFFIPDSAPGMEAEGTYARIVAAAEADIGHAPRPVRIFRLSFRHHGADLDAEVGRPDPVGGGTVLAILDLGRESPYLIHCSPVDGFRQQVLVRKPVYSVTEFSD